MRSQLEVAQRVSNSNVGTTLDAKKITPSSLNSAIRKAIDKRRKVQEMADIFSDAETTNKCVHVIENILAQSQNI